MQSLKAMLIGRRPFPLCQRTLCNGKQVIWTYLILLYSYHELSNSLCMLFSDVLEKLYIFAVITEPFQTSFLAPYILNIFSVRLKIKIGGNDRMLKNCGFYRIFFLNYPSKIKNENMLLMTYVEKTSYFEVPSPCHTMLTRYIDNLF